MGGVKRWAGLHTKGGDNPKRPYFAAVGQSRVSVNSTSRLCAGFDSYTTRLLGKYPAQATAHQHKDGDFGHNRIRIKEKQI